MFDLILSDYQIVYPKYNTSYLVMLRLKELQKQLEGLKVFIDIVKDSEIERNREIVIGKTNRLNEKSFISLEEYEIEPNGNKLFIDGGSVGAIISAIDCLSLMIYNKKFVVKNTIKGEGRGDKVGEYGLVLIDDFSGDKLNEMWSPYSRNNYPERYTNKVTGQVINCYRSEDNILVKDGKLLQKIIKEDDNTLVGAKMTTSKSFWFRYGYTEVSIKIASGSGTGSGFWLHGNADKLGRKYCEFDIVEIYGDPKFNRFSPLALTVGKGKNISAWYLGDYNRSHTRVWLQNDEKISEQYHTFGLEWDENYYRFTMDGEVVFENKYTDWDNSEKVDCYRQPVHAIISINGGNFDWKKVEPDSSEPDFSNNNWIDDNIQLVDYFFVYQKENQSNGKTFEEVLLKDKM